MGLFDTIRNAFSSKREPVDWDSLEESLIRSDLGIQMTMAIMDRLQSKGGTLYADDVVAVCHEEIRAILPPPTPPPVTFPGKPRVIIMVGVNGVGKTTTTAKLAHYLTRHRHKVVLAAADTFRAAAIEQLQTWAARIDVPIVSGEYKADPSSICYDAYQKAEATGAGFLICDTAGRLHTRHNLMEEIKKISRTLKKKDPDAPHETLLVVDATTGSNALNQAKEFNKALGLTGVVVTKLDGSGKGGCVISIQKELGIPTKYVGSGESVDALAPFQPKRFVEELL